MPGWAMAMKQRNVVYEQAVIYKANGFYLLLSLLIFAFRKLKNASVGY